MMWVTHEKWNKSKTPYLRLIFARLGIFLGYDFGVSKVFLYIDANIHVLKTINNELVKKNKLISELEDTSSIPDENILT